MKTVEMVAGWLLVLGGVSLGLDALASFNLLNTIFGSGTTLLKLVDVLIGVSAVMMGYKMLGMDGKKK